MMPAENTLTAVYTAAHQDAILVDRSRLGLLKISGATRLDLINRMSTQAVKQLHSGQGAATILTSDIGRMIDRLILYAAADHIYALTGEENAGNIARYLLRFVFFNDDFHLEDCTPQTAIWGVYGQAAPARLRPLFGDGVNLPLHHWQQFDLDGVTLYLHRADPVAGSGYFVMCQVADKEAAAAHLQQAGITQTATAGAFEYLRIESGLPRHGHEITLDYIPLEANLWDDVSFSKGCYTGQEIIARMESRGRLAKKLFRLRPAQPVTAGSDLTLAGRTIGAITSAADGPNGPVALGYLKTNALDEDLSTLTASGIPVKLAGA